jgi:hypothetical protein
VSARAIALERKENPNPARDMSDLYQELQDDVRQKRLEELWKKWGNYVLGGAAVILAAVGGWQYWLYAESEAKAKAAIEFAKAAKIFTEPGQESKAAEAFAKLAADAPDGYAAAARMQEAAARLMLGQTAQAVAIYDQIAETGSGGDTLAGFARYRAALALADSAPQADVLERLEPLASKPGPWAGLARELKAYVTWRAGNLTEALKQYEMLAKDETAPENVKRRAKNMSELLTLGVKPSGVAPAPGAAQAPDVNLDLLPESLRAPEIPEMEAAPETAPPPLPQ